MIPLPIQHRQPQAAAEDAVQNVIESVWTSLLPNSKRTQYLLHWYIAETLPPEDEARIGPPPLSRQYQVPPPFPPDTTLRDRLAAEPDDHGPIRYPNTAVDEEEACYASELVSVDEAIKKLGRSSMAEVVRIGWERIGARLLSEEAASFDVAAPVT